MCVSRAFGLPAALLSKHCPFLSCSLVMSTLVCLCTDWLPPLPLLPVMPLLSALHAELLAAWLLSALSTPVTVSGLEMPHRSGHMTVMTHYGLRSCSKTGIQVNDEHFGKAEVGFDLSRPFYCT